MASGAVEFLRICGKLKTLKRTGWVDRKVPSSESVSDHMYRMAMCSLLIDEKITPVDKSRCIKIAIVHDLAEAIVGDITPHAGVSKKDKHRLEKEAMGDICKTLGDSHVATEIFELWKEYEDGLTPEALLVKDFDKFEMILQADEYEKAYGNDLTDFFTSTKGVFTTPLVQSWVAELEASRCQVKVVKKDEEAVE